MKKVILFGATGHLGKEIAKELVRQGYDLTLAVRSEAKALSLSGISTKYLIADVCQPETLKGILDGQEIVVSAMGKSVSPNDHSKPGFREVDFVGNSNILREAQQAGIPKMVYISALHSEHFLHLEYFRVHHEFSELLKQSGLDYTIIKPPAIFSAFLDIIEMARKGQLFHIGKGENKTNPIFEGDLARIVVTSMTEKNATVEAGGRHVYTRRQLNEIIQNEVNSRKKLFTVPVGMYKAMLPMIRIFNKNMYDKFAFFLEVMQHDVLAPKMGEMPFEAYVKEKARI